MPTAGARPARVRTGRGSAGKLGSWALDRTRLAGLVGSYDAAVITKDPSGKVHENRDETATRHGAWWGVAAGAAVGVLFPPAVLGPAAVGGVIGGIGGHLAKGMSRSEAKELGDFIDPGQAGLVVVGEGKVEDAIKQAMTRAGHD